MKRVVGYVRSNGNLAGEATDSVLVQHRELQRFAADTNAKLVKVYVDQCSGVGEFEQRDIMIAELADENVDAVIVASLSRLSRDPVHLRRIIQALAAWDIEVIAADAEAANTALSLVTPHS